MIIIIAILAFTLTWFFIEITLFIVDKINYERNLEKQIAYKKFIWNLRILAILLIFFTIIYMYFFESDKLLEAVEYCLGVIR